MGPTPLLVAFDNGRLGRFWPPRLARNWLQGAVLVVVMLLNLPLVPVILLDSLLINAFHVTGWFAAAVVFLYCLVRLVRHIIRFS